MNDTPASDAADTGAAQQPCEATVLTRRVWQHTFGEMLIETRSDGSVWIDGKVVADTLPSQPMDVGGFVAGSRN